MRYRRGGDNNLYGALSLRKSVDMSHCLIRKQLFLKENLQMLEEFEETLVMELEKIMKNRFDELEEKDVTMKAVIEEPKKNTCSSGSGDQR